MSNTEHSSYQLISSVFLRLLGVIYLIAFASLGTQVEGLIGSQGILPLATRLAEYAAETGLERYLQAPTLFWLHAGDTTLIGATVAGALAAVLIILNIWQRTALVAAFLLYLSLFHACLLYTSPSPRDFSCNLV